MYDTHHHRIQFNAKSLTVSLGLLFAVGLSLLLFKLHVPNKPSNAATAGFSISVSGNHLINSGGKTVQLTGVDRMIGCTKNHLFNGPADQAEVTAMKNWGINAVRISTMNEDCWLGINGQPAQFTVAQYRSAVINYVKLLNQNGIYAIVDLHLNDPGSYSYPAQQVMADADHSLAYWNSLATAFKGNPAVIFEAYNEPHPTTADTTASDPWKCWRDGCTATVLNHSYNGPKTSLNWQTAGMQQIVTTIRNTGATNVISLGGLSFSNNLSKILAKDAGGKPYLPSDPDHQLAISFHNYKGWGCGTTACWNSQVLPVANQIPVITTEFGQHDCKQDFNNTWFPWADSHGISYTAWVWTPGTCPGGVTSGDAGAWGLLANWNGAPNTYGQPVLAHIKARSGGGGGQPTPSESVTAPAAGATVKGTVTVSATATVSSGSITKLVISAGGVPLKTCAAGSCSSSWDTTKVANGTRTVTASATASDGKSSTSSETVTVNNVPPPPTVPSNITSPSQTTSSISLSWSASTDANYAASQIKYNAFRNGAKVGTTAAGTASFTDTGLAAGTYYSYTVSATDPAGRSSAQSAAFTQNTKTPSCGKPNAPGGFMATGIQATSVSLKWNPVSDPSSTCKVTGYVLSRDSAPIKQGTSTNYTDTTVVANTKYTYSVLAVETGNIAGPSSSISVTTPVSTQPDPGPTAPTRVTGAAVSTSQINLAWSASTDSVTGIKQYNILRDGKQIGQSSTTSFGDSGLNANTVYKYQVIAVSGGGKTAASDSVSVKTLKPNGNPGNGQHPGGGSTGGGGTPPILQGTHSVGSGSDTGQSSSNNPTAGSSGGDSGGANGTGTTNVQPTPKKSDALKNAAYVGAGILLLLIAAAIIISMRRRRQVEDWAQPMDADLTAHTGDTIYPQTPTVPTQTGAPQNPNEPSEPDGSEKNNEDPFRRGH